MPLTLTERVAENPFFVLCVEPTASRQDVERAGQKWLSMLALGLKEAGSYETPVGPRTRTETLVREAMNELRDPQRRLVAELLAGLPATVKVATPAAADPRARVQWKRALLAFSLGPERP